MARSLVKILKQEMSEIETCPDCYMNAHQNPKSWFTEVCVSTATLNRKPFLNEQDILKTAL